MRQKRNLWCRVSRSYQVGSVEKSSEVSSLKKVFSNDTGTLRISQAVLRHQTTIMRVSDLKESERASHFTSMLDGRGCISLARVVDSTSSFDDYCPRSLWV